MTITTAAAATAITTTDNNDYNENKKMELLDPIYNPKLH